MTDIISFDIELTPNQKKAQHKLYQVHQLYDEIEKLLGTQDIFNKPHLVMVLPSKLKKEQLTNFERVTASPEALAKWICEITDFCDRGCCRCPVEEKCLYDSDGAGNKDNEQLLVELLKEKSNCGEK